MAKRITFLLILLISSVIAFSQNCALNLRAAEELFNAGQVEEVPAQLEQCLRSGFTKAEELKAYQIIIRSYLFDDKHEAAEDKMLEFLKKNPEYRVRETDNADFIYLLNQFDVKPLINIGITGGGVMTFVSGLEANHTSGIPGESDYRNDKITATGGFNLLVNVGNKFEIGTGIEYSELSFSFTEQFLNYSEIIYKERQRRLEVPLQLYYFPYKFGLLRPYVKAGAGLSLNLSTTADAQQNNLDINNPIQHPPVIENITNRRQSIDPFLSAGMGCRVKLPNSYIFAEVGATMGTRIQTKGGEPSNLEFFYGFTDDLYKLNTLRFNVGYIIIFYKPTKKEE